MFGGSGRNGFGLGLVAGICVTLGFCLWVWWPLEAVVSPKTDTLVQWTMAIVGVLATLVSFYAVFLIKDTLAQTIETNQAAVAAANAANEANAIMRGEQRPWVTMIRDVDCEIQISDWGMSVAWTYSLVNKGKSPAYDVAVSCKAIRRPHLQHMPEHIRAFAEASIARRPYFKTKIIFPSETIEFGAPHEFSDAYTSKKEVIAEGYPMLMVCITYHLGLDSQEIGADAYMFGFEPDAVTSGTVKAKMLGHSNARYVQ